MLPKSLRLKNSELFQKAFRFGKPFFFGNIGCKVIFSKDTGKKVGFSLSKKIFPRAVDRNRAKRALSDVAALFWDDIPEGIFVVFFLRTHEGFLEKERLMKDFPGLISKVNASKPQ